MPRTTEADRIASLLDMRDMLLAYLAEHKTLKHVIADIDGVISRRLKRQKDAQQ